MPRYDYRCDSCELVFEIVHSMKEKIVDCDKCNAKDSLERLPSFANIVVNKTQDEKAKKPGQVVKEFIEDAKKDTKVQKQQLAKEYEI